MSFEPVAPEGQESDVHIPLEQLAADVKQVLHGNGGEFLQALLLAVVGYLGGLGFYFAGSEAFNHLLGGQRITGGFICQITPLHGLAALALALVVPALVALAGATRAIRIQPAESLREL